MLTASSLTKSYGPTKALIDVSAEFKPGEIHAVLGENGAGKSTLMHILSGFSTPDRGLVSLHGKPIPLGHPFECRKLGIAMVHQHFTLVPAFTVRENLALARLSGLGWIDETSLIANAVDIARDLGWEFDPGLRTRGLPVGAQQRIEIVKALAGRSQVVIFDEPTAVLSPSEVHDLFRVLRQLRDSGKIVILIAHKLTEVLAIADRVTVLRKGVKVAEAATRGVTAEHLAEWMVGEMPPAISSTPIGSLMPGLIVKDLSTHGDRGELALRGLTFEVRRGEIVGFGGVDGNGQLELAEVLAEVRPYSGTMNWQEDEPPAATNPVGQGAAAPSSQPNAHLLRHRIAYIPQDRQTDGLALTMSLEDNLLVTGHRRRELTSGPFLSPAKSKRWADEQIARFEIKAGSSRVPVSSLSGGNQQKVVVARALDETPDLLIAVNPTRGLDVKATDYVHRQILAARDAGAAVVLITTDLDELALLASRRYFLSRGSIVEGEDASALLGGAE